MKRLSPFRTGTILLGSLCVISTALATTYVRVEKDGTKTYSDRPLPGGQPVELERAQTYTPAPAPSGANPNSPAEQRLLEQIDDFQYQSCAVTPPQDETFINPTSVPINITLEPHQRATDQITLSVDGKTVATNVFEFVLQPVERGTHTVTVTVKDSFGRVVCNSSSSFHVHRPSVNLPNRR